MSGETTDSLKTERLIVILQAGIAAAAILISLHQESSRRLKLRQKRDKEANKQKIKLQKQKFQAQLKQEKLKAKMDYRKEKLRLRKDYAESQKS